MKLLKTQMANTDPKKTIVISSFLTSP